eukprot:GHVU01217931.1.p1 GENE.GHVU01217931.1~~GHVU01217931.1.p1  ORF type:complete len:295 (-),score=25.73 GHVU01217931.1:1179-2063(-)
MVIDVHLYTRVLLPLLLLSLSATNPPTGGRDLCTGSGVPTDGEGMHDASDEASDVTDEEAVQQTPRRRRGQNISWSSAVQTYTTGSFKVNLAAALVRIKLDDTGNWRVSHYSGAGYSVGVAHFCVAHETETGEPCGACMGAFGDGRGTVHIKVSGAHGKRRIDDKFGVPYEFRTRVIHQFQSQMGPTKIVEELENDVHSHRLMAVNVPMPTARQVKALWEWYKSKMTGAPRNAVSMAAAVDFVEYMRKPGVDYSLREENDIIVLENLMGTQEGFFFTSRKVRSMCGEGPAHVTE